MRELERTTELSALEAGALYIILFFRSTDDNDFHWGLYHHINANEGVWKFHIIGFERHWYADHGSEKIRGALASNAVVGLMRLTNLGVDQDVSEEVLRIITAEDEELNSIVGLTCRVYVGRACERLGAARFIDFPDWSRLQTEVFEFGNEAKGDFKEGKGPKPRPVKTSSVAK